MKIIAASALALGLSACAGQYALPPDAGQYALPPGALDNRPSSMLPHDEHGGPGEPTTQIASAVRESAPPPPTPPLRTVPIEYFEGQPLVRIGIPGVGSFRCVLDTGSSDLVIPIGLVKQLPLRDVTVLDIGRAELAGGASIKTLNVVFREVDIGPWALKNVPTSINPAGDCLFGMSILSLFGHPIIDFAEHRLILED
jgi:hypothetical protein